LEPARIDLPAVSIAHTTGVAVAIAAPDPRARVGIDVEPIAQRSSDFERLALVDAERTCLDGLAAEPGTDRAQWVARLWCAKEAVAKATGLGLVVGPTSVAIVGADRSTGEVTLTLGPELSAHCPDLAGNRIRAVTARHGEYVWAWTLCERID
jgi:phosphopantetheinyl transferase